MTDSGNAILVGGPRDGARFTADDAALVELQIGGLFHRYVRTTAVREAGGQSLPVYNYDGETRGSTAPTAIPDPDPSPEGGASS